MDNNQDADYGLIANNSDEQRTVHLRHGGMITFDPPIVSRDKIHAFEAEMKKNVPTAEEAAQLAKMTVKHYWSYGIYGRELFLPKDVMIAGEIHKYPNMNVIMSGDISIFIDGEIKRVQAPFIFVAPAGSKRIAYAHEDTIWFMPHRTDEVDVDRIENLFIAHTETEYLEFVNQQLELPLIDRYPIFKRELGI